MKDLSLFMQVYMYELEQFLNQRHNEIQNVSFQSDEANTDRPLKEYLKSVIETSFSSLPPDSSIRFLSQDGEAPIPVNDLSSITIRRVLLREELTDRIRQEIVKSKGNAVYTDPDLCLELEADGQITYQTIELKSTKTDAIPGSSVQQVLPEEWAIFIQRKKGVQVVTGQYLHAVNCKLAFPDRSPRPQVSFSELLKWNQLHRKADNGECLCYTSDETEDEKMDLLQDWQGVLSHRWVTLLFEATSVKPNEPWFNNNLRKFILEFLQRYESLSPAEQKAFKEKNEKWIKR